MSQPGHLPLLSEAEAEAHALRRLNLGRIEHRVMQSVIDLHDAARLAAPLDPGAASMLRRLAQDLSDVVRRMRALLPTQVDSQWGDIG